MQWLIDIIIEAAKAQIGYIDRGDVGPFDWEIADFTRDFAWHELDISGIVPLDARQVKFAVIISTPFVGRTFQMRTPGNTGVTNRSAVWSTAANKFQEQLFLVAPSPDGKIEYRATAGFSGTLGVTVGGWWL